jgi:hypothetical protein
VLVDHAPGSEVAGVSAALAMVLLYLAVRLFGLPMTTWAFYLLEWRCVRPATMKPSALR